jgi:hypothetical protein
VPVRRLRLRLGVGCWLVFSVQLTQATGSKPQTFFNIPRCKMKLIAAALIAATSVAVDLRGSKPNIIWLFAGKWLDSWSKTATPPTDRTMGPCEPAHLVSTSADDFGWADVGQNNPEVKETPTIDALAAGGIHFTDAHAFPLCTPSRAQLLTGRVGMRTGVTTNFGTGAMFGLPRTEHTVAELLKPAGYDTAMGGKWHLGTHPGFHPSYRGFDRILSVPYSVDMGCLGPESGPYYNLPQVCASMPTHAPPESARLAKHVPARSTLLHSAACPVCNGPQH